MSFYLERLRKRGVKLTHEQLISRKALKMPTRIPTINKMRAKMDKIVAREFERKQAV